MKIGKPRMRERGQGLVEYALILVLVGLVVIVSLVIFGDRLQKTYCQAVYSLDPNVDAPFCEALSVSCQVQTSSPFRLEAVVTDMAGDDNITRVQFFVDDHLYNTELYYKYCLQNGDGPLCDPYLGAHGKHKFSAVAYDADGHTGTCTLEVTIP
jgi:Flp pilus assembly pilin Flp